MPSASISAQTLKPDLSHCCHNNQQTVPAIMHPATTRTTEVITRIEGFFFNIKHANSKLVKGRSLLSTLYLKIEFQKMNCFCKELPQ